jgi:hypothetical protein
MNRIRNIIPFKGIFLIKRIESLAQLKLYL